MNGREEEGVEEGVAQFSIGVGGRNGGGEVRRWGLLMGDTFMGVEDSEWVDDVVLLGETAGVEVEGIQNLQGDLPTR